MLGFVKKKKKSDQWLDLDSVSLRVTGPDACGYCSGASWKLLSSLMVVLFNRSAAEGTGCYLHWASQESHADWLDSFWVAEAFCCSPAFLCPGQRGIPLLVTAGEEVWVPLEWGKGEVVSDTGWKDHWECTRYGKKRGICRLGTARSVLLKERSWERWK